MNAHAERRSLSRRIKTPYVDYIGCHTGRELWFLFAILALLAYIGIRFHV